MNELRGTLWFQRSVGLLCFALITYVLVIPFAYSLLHNFDQPTKSVHALEEMSFPFHVLLKGSEAITVLAVFALGCSIGSFLNVVVYRLPLRQSLIFKRSHCPACNHEIASRDNLPIIGWLLLNGRCRNCEQPISSRYPIVELITGSLFVLLLFVQLLSGGANIPVRTPNLYTGFVWILFYTKWDLVGLFLYHCFLLCTVFTWSLIALDKKRIPLNAILISLLCAVLPTVIWPELHPIAAAQAHSQQMTAGIHGWGLLDSIVGLLAGFGLGMAFSRLYPAEKNFWIATAPLLGAVLGWTAVVAVLSLFSVLYLVFCFAVKKQLQNTLSIGVGFFLVLIFHHLFWNHIHELEMYGSDWFGAFVNQAVAWLQSSDLHRVAKPFGAGMIAAFACGLGVCPLFVPQLRSISLLFNGYAYASGVMLATSIFSLLWPAMSYATAVSADYFPVSQIGIGIVVGCSVIWLIERQLVRDNGTRLSKISGNRTAMLVFIGMTIHSAPEGWAVGAAYVAEQHHPLFHNAGLSIALAIAIHNIPEGLIVAIPMRAQGLGLGTCFTAAFLTSLPQPFAAIPACFAIWNFQPLLLPALSISAGAMLYLIFSELLPQAIRQSTATVNATSFVLGILTLMGIPFVLN